MIIATVLDVALCSLVTVGVVAFCVLARFAAFGRDA